MSEHVVSYHTALRSDRVGGEVPGLAPWYGGTNTAHIWLDVVVQVGPLVVGARRFGRAECERPLKLSGGGAINAADARASHDILAGSLLFKHEFQVSQVFLRALTDSIWIPRSVRSQCSRAHGDHSVSGVQILFLAGWNRRSRRTQKQRRPKQMHLEKEDDTGSANHLHLSDWTAI